MLKSFISTLTEPRHGRQIHEFNAVPLSRSNRSKLTFIVNEKAGEKRLVLVLQDDEGHEIEREYCEVDMSCVDGIARLVDEVRSYVKSNS